MNDVELWRELGQQLRVDAIRPAAKAGSGHPTSGMSAADLMAVLLAKYLRYDFDNPHDPHNDRLVFSKGHASTLLYAMFRAAGAISEEELLTYRQFDSIFEGHPTPRIPWVDVATGSLGQGLPYSVGIALAGKRLDRLPFRVWTLCGDSEIAEGSQWEALEHAAHFELDNLVAIIDVNRLGQRGETMHGWDLDSYADRARAFGCHAIEIDGHDVEAIDRAYAEAIDTAGQPVVIVAKTIKGKGDPDVEDKNGFHGKALDHSDEVIATLGGVRHLEIEVAKPETGAAKHEFPTEPLELPQYELGAEVATRKAYGDALAALGKARGDVVALDGEVSNSTFAEEFRDAHPRPLLRDVHRRAADGRDRGRDAGARLAAVRLDLRRVPVTRLRLHPHVGDQPRELLPLRLACRHLDRRGRAVADGARGHCLDPRRPRLDGAAPVRREPDREARRADGRHRGDRLPPHAASQHDRHLRAGRGLRDRRLADGASGRRRRDRRRRDHRPRGAEGRRHARAGGDRGARDRPLLDQASRRRDAALAHVPDRHGRGSLGGGRPRRGRAQRRSRTSDERPPVVQLAVHEMPHSGKPAELLAEAGIDADGIAAAARSLARAHAGAS